MGKNFGLVMLGLGAVMLVIAIAATAFGGTTSSASEIAKQTSTSANRVESTVRKLDTLGNDDFNFPSIFGSDFVSGSNCVDGSCGHAEHMRDENTIWLASDEQQSGRPYRVGRHNYSSRYIDAEALNFDSPAFNTFLAELDDLYVLCADVAVANEKCNLKITEIRSVAMRLKQLANELRQSDIQRDTQNGAAFEMLNKHNTELNNAISTLSKDRGNLGKRARTLPRDMSGIKVTHTTKRYMAMMNRIEGRIKLLDDVKVCMENICTDIEALLGKETQTPGENQGNLNFLKLPIQQQARVQQQIQQPMQQAKQQVQQPIQQTQQQVQQPIQQTQQQTRVQQPIQQRQQQVQAIQQAQQQTRIQQPIQQNQHPIQQAIQQQKARLQKVRQESRNGVPEVIAPNIKVETGNTENNIAGRQAYQDSVQQSNNTFRSDFNKASLGYRNETAPELVAPSHTDTNADKSEGKFIEKAPQDVITYQQGSYEQTQPYRKGRKVWRAPEIREDFDTEQVAGQVRQLLSKIA